jgi:hypothetical protein
MKHLVVVVVLAAACGGDPPPNPMPTEIAQIEARIREPFRGVAIARDGIYFDRKKLAPLADFAAVRPQLIAALQEHRGGLRPAQATGYRDPPAIAMALVVVPDPAISSGLVTGAIDAVAAAGWHNLSLRMIRSDRASGHHDLERLCDVRWSGDDYANLPADDRPVELSVLGQADKLWVGLSRVNEFQVIEHIAGERPDYDKLEATLEEHKASAFFADRTDVQVAVDPAVAPDVLLFVIDVACKAGFDDVRVREPARLSALPTL